MVYDNGTPGMGNITQRSDVNGNATWTYHTTKKHAVASTGTGGASYSYDANGNMTSRDGQTIGWASYNYPTTLATATENTTFYYGPDRQYYRQDYGGPSTSETTYYIGGVLEKVNTSGVTDWLHYIGAEGQTVAIVSRKSSGGSPNTVSYPLEDNQGSGSTFSDGSGGLLVRESFNAFGLPRDGNDWDGTVPSGDLTTIEGISRRGYTGHSMLGRMGLIHMNGRVQDAVTGRFLSADPTVPNPGFTQSYNRYAYVNNNPLSFIDPSGFCPPQDQVTTCPGDEELRLVLVEGARHYCQQQNYSRELEQACLSLAMKIDSLSNSELICLLYGFCPGEGGTDPQVANPDPFSLGGQGTSGSPQTQKPQTPQPQEQVRKPIEMSPDLPDPYRYLAVRMEISGMFFVWDGSNDGDFLGIYQIDNAPCFFICRIKESQWDKALVPGPAPGWPLGREHRKDPYSLPLTM
jgi:RHS repeat-associated protein